MLAQFFDLKIRIHGIGMVVSLNGGTLKTPQNDPF